MQSSARVAPPEGRRLVPHGPIGQGVVIALVLGLMSGMAWAEGRSDSRSGTLARTTSAVREHTTSRSGPSAPSSGGSPDAPIPRPVHDDYYAGSGWYRGGCATCVPMVAGPYYPGSAVRRGPVPPTRLTLEVGLQAVDGSDGAGRASAQLSRGVLGIAASAARYFEQAPAMDGTDMIFMDVWSVTIAGRLVRAADSELWVHGGLGGTGSTEFEHIMGPVVGASLVHPLGRSMWLQGSARYFVLEHETRASEVSAGLGVSFLSVGYRVFRFNVGPALHGPAFDLSLRL